MCRGHKQASSRRWEHTRLISYTIAAANRDPKKSFPDIEKYFPLPTDEQQLREKEDDLTAMRQRMINYYNKTFGKNLA